LTWNEGRNHINYGKHRKRRKYNNGFKLRKPENHRRGNRQGNEKIFYRIRDVDDNREGFAGRPRRAQAHSQAYYLFDVRAGADV